MSILRRLIRLPLRLVPPNREVRIRSGALRGWRWITGSATHGCWLGNYEPEAQRVFTTLVRDGHAVYDVGANVGFFTLLAAKLAGERGAVYAFEPIERNLGYLRRHIAANKLSTVHVLPIAVSSHAGVAFFNSGHNPAMGKLADAGDVEVRTAAIDDLVAAGELRPPDFVKIDVEGAEYDVLTGAAATLRRYRPPILLSAHGWRLHDQCNALLREWGYTLEEVRDGREDGQYTVLAR
ncbi:MAG TPA: FkbM family methyltransferase [Thermoanaerobaculia bacterium]